MSSKFVEVDEEMLDTLVYNIIANGTYFDYGDYSYGSHCTYCDVNLDNKEEHLEGCSYVLANKLADSIIPCC